MTGITEEGRAMTVEEKKPLWQRLGWLVLIWALSVAALGVVAYGMRLFMNAAGLTTH